MYYDLTVVKGENAFAGFKTSLSVVNYGSLKSLAALCLSLEKGPSKTHVLKTWSESVVLLRDNASAKTPALGRV